MELPSKSQIKDWMKAFGRSREWLADQLGKSKNTVNNWLSTNIEIPAATLHLIARLMDDDAQIAAEKHNREDSELSHVTLRITTDELNDWSRAFKLSDAGTLEEWAIEAIRSAYAEDQKTLKYPEPKPDLLDRVAEPSPHDYDSPGSMAKAALERKKKQASQSETRLPSAD